MNRNTLLITLITALFFPGIISAAPIVYVYQDDLSLYAHTELTTIDNVTITKTASYHGPLLPVDREASVSGWALEEPCNPDGTGCIDQYGHSATAEASTTSNSIDLFTYSLFYPATGPIPPLLLPVWDLVTDPIQESIAELSWVFSVDQDISFEDIYFVKNSGDGYTSALLKDLTTNVTLLDFAGTTGIDHFENIALAAGHKYALDAAAADFYHDDDTEAYIDFYFSEDVTFVSVPEPSAAILISIGLVLIGANRKAATS